MKRKTGICLLIICVLMSTGCGSSNSYSSVATQANIAESTRFSQLANWKEKNPKECHYSILWDKAEDIVYLKTDFCSSSGYSVGGITVMFDRDGKPMTRGGWYRSIDNKQTSIDSKVNTTGDIIINNTVNNER